MWQLLPAGVREKELLGHQNLFLWLGGKTVSVLEGTNLEQKIRDGHKENWVRGCISSDLSLFPSDNLNLSCPPLFHW